MTTIRRAISLRWRLIASAACFVLAVALGGALVAYTPIGAVLGVQRASQVYAQPSKFGKTDGAGTTTQPYQFEFDIDHKVVDVARRVTDTDVVKLNDDGAYLWIKAPLGDQALDEPSRYIEAQNRLRRYYESGRTPTPEILFIQGFFDQFGYPVEARDVKKAADSYRRALDAKRLLTKAKSDEQPSGDFYPAAANNLAYLISKHKTLKDSEIGYLRDLTIKLIDYIAHPQENERGDTLDEWTNTCREVATKLDDPDLQSRVAKLGRAPTTNVSSQ